MNKALFLDRDGTINIDKAYLYKPDEFEFIPQTIELCKIAQAKGYLLIVITNQSGVARGYYTEEDMHNCNNYMIEEFKNMGIKITDIFCCPFLDSNNPDRKPNPGMFLKAIKKYDIDVTKSISYGDKDRDVRAGQNANIKFNFLTTEFNEIKTLLEANDYE